VTQRTHEIGIRVALGAARRDVLRMVVRQGMLLAAVGIAAGLAGGAIASRVLSSLLFGVRPTDPATFVAVSAILLAVAFVACFLPARRATRIDAMTALREE
jgi:putative ABC transport system permease protein